MNNLSHLEGLQKHIERILSTRPTAREIADEFLNRPSGEGYFHLHQRITVDEAITNCRKSLDNALYRKLENRNNHEELIYRVYSAAKIYKLPVLAELGKIYVEEFRGCIDDHESAEKKLRNIKKDITAIDRILNNPLSPDTRSELLNRKTWLMDILNQGRISITRQQETALQYLVFLDKSSAPLINDFVLVRENCPPNETYKQALVIIITDILCLHSKNERQSRKSVVQKLAHDIIVALIPSIEGEVSFQAIRHALTK